MPKRKMKNQKRNTSNEENNPAIKQESSRFDDHYISRNRENKQIKKLQTKSVIDELRYAQYVLHKHNILIITCKK